MPKISPIVIEELSHSLDKKLQSAYIKMVNNLRNGHFSRGMHFERISGKIYSSRVNEKARALIFKPDLSPPIFIVFEVDESHKYDKELRHITSNFLKKLWNKNLPAIEQELCKHTEREERKQVLDKVRAFTVKDAKVARPLNLSFEKGQIICFDSTQQCASEAETPAIITGEAGTGKTSVATEILVRLHDQDLNAGECKESDRLPHVYVTSSARLVAQVQQNFEATCGQDHNMVFATWEQLFEQYGQSHIVVGYHKLQGEDKDTKNTCALDLRVWLQQQPISPSLDKRKVAEEFIFNANVLATADKKAYLALAPRDSLFKTQHKREKILSLFQEYCAKLKKENKFNWLVNPIRWRRKNRPATVIVDEAQDNSPLMLEGIRALAPNRYYFIGDDGQLLDQDLSALSAFSAQHPQVNRVHLNLQYRSTHSLERGNRYLRSLRLALQGGTQEKRPAQHQLINTPSPKVNSPLTLAPETSTIKPGFYKASRSECSHLGGSAHCAVITSEANFEKVQRLWPNTLVFTPEDIKGLEFDTVIIQSLFNPSLLAEAQEKLRLYEGKQEQNGALRLGRRPIESIGKSEGKARTLAGYYVSTSRARVRAIVILNLKGNPHPAVEALLSKLQAQPYHESKATSEGQSISLEAQIEEWKKLQEKCAEEGLVAQVKRCEQTISQLYEKLSSSTQSIQNIGSPSTSLKPDDSTLAHAVQHLNKIIFSKSPLAPQEIKKALDPLLDMAASPLSLPSSTLEKLVAIVFNPSAPMHEEVVQSLDLYSQNVAHILPPDWQQLVALKLNLIEKQNNALFRCLHFLSKVTDPQESVEHLNALQNSNKRALKNAWKRVEKVFQSPLKVAELQQLGKKTSHCMDCTPEYAECIALSREIEEKGFEGTLYSKTKKSPFEPSSVIQAMSYHLKQSPSLPSTPGFARDFKLIMLKTLLAAVKFYLTSPSAHEVDHELHQTLIDKIIWSINDPDTKVANLAVEAMVSIHHTHPINHWEEPLQICFTRNLLAFTNKNCDIDHERAAMVLQGFYLPYLPPASPLRIILESASDPQQKEKAHYKVALEESRRIVAQASSDQPQKPTPGLNLLLFILGNFGLMASVGGTEPLLPNPLTSLRLLACSLADISYYCEEDAFYLPLLIQSLISTLFVLSVVYSLNYPQSSHRPATQQKKKETTVSTRTLFYGHGNESEDKKARLPETPPLEH